MKKILMTFIVYILLSLFSTALNIPLQARGDVCGDEWVNCTCQCTLLNGEEQTQCDKDCLRRLKTCRFTNY